MTLEDFFTLSEMKDGLATLNRVEELLGMMKNQQDSVRNIVGDAARQWATVASILAVTENKDCLDHFIQLNGLSFLNHWLQEARKWSDDNTDCSVEELISALLQALDNLPVDKEKLSASGVGATVKQFHGYRSHNIQEKAGTLFGKWNHVEDSDSKHQNIDENGPSCSDGPTLSTEATRAQEGVPSTNSVPWVSPSDNLLDENAKSCSNSSPDDTAKDVKVLSDRTSHGILNSLDRNVILGETEAVGSSLAFNPCQESQSNKEESVCPASGVASTGTCGSPDSKGRIVDQPPDVSDRKYASDGPEDMDIVVNVKESPCRSGQKELHIMSTETAFHRMDDIETTSDSKENESEQNLKAGNGVESKISTVLKPPIDAYMVSEIDRRRPEIGLEPGEIDALEVARQVAIEVEREVVDYREPFCSSPEVISRGEIDSCSSEFADNKNEKLAGERLSENESPARKDPSDDTLQRDSTRTSEDVDIKDSAHDQESPKSTSVQESIVNTDRNKCVFDLNEDACFEETDCQMIPAVSQTNLSAPILVAASKGAPSLPVIPLHFEGELGWRGSAATSAFRPASPRRTSDGEKNMSGPKQKANFLKIDLNVADDEDVIAVDHILEKHTPFSSSIPSDKSSMEMSSQRSGRLKLDLNCIGDEDTMPNQSSYWRSHDQNGNCSPSPASSSCSRQPSMRDFDLNDNPLLFDACGSSSLGKSSSKETSTYGSYKLDDPVITIMGSRMSVDRKELVNHTQQSFLGTGHGADSAISARAAVPYPPMPPHAYGYHGLQMGPAMSIPPAFYAPGSIPYMVDSRGATIIPQILGSTGISGSTAARPPFLMGMAGVPPGMRMVGGVSRPSLDLNSATTAAEGGSRDMGSFKQLFMQGNSGLMDDHMTSASQPTSSGVVLKRKEPDCGWEPSTFGYKQATWH